MQHGIQKIYPQLEREIKHLMEVNKDCTPTISIEDIPITTPISGDGYSGVVYVPHQNIIYFIPRYQYNISKWHYFNVTENKMYEYTPHKTFDTAYYDYYGAIYDYKYQRIIMLPCVDYQDSIFIDVSNYPPRVKKNVTNALSGGYKFKGVADIYNNKIYTCPYATSSSYVDIINTSNSDTIAYDSISITNETPIYHPSYLLSSTLIRENNHVYYLISDSIYLYHHSIDNPSTVYKKTIYSNPSHTANAYALFGNNQVYIPHLKRSYAGNGSQFLNFTNNETTRLTQNVSIIDTKWGMNGLNGKIYHLTGAGLINVTDIVTNTISSLSIIKPLGENTTSQPVMTTDGKIIIFRISASQISTNVKMMTINLNLKVKPSQDLLLSGLINVA